MLDYPKALLWQTAASMVTLIFMLGGWIGHNLTGFPHVLANLLYAIAYFSGGIFGLRAGLKSLYAGRVDIDVLMILAALGAAVVDHPFEGAMLLFLFSLSNALQGFAMHRTRKAIHSLMKLRPDKALVRRDGQAVLLPIEQLVVGDIIVIRPGELFPLDAVVVEGESAVDESSLTGESIPVYKKTGDLVFAATMNQGGALEAKVNKLARESAVEKLINAVEEAQNQKATTQRTLERAEQYYSLGVILLTAALIAVPLSWGAAFDQTFYRAITVMVVASPCALILSTPASFLSAIGGAARRGILFKGGLQLEAMAGIQVVAFDKTGTLTQGKPRVTDLLPGHAAIDGREMLQIAASIEAKSEHPLAAAIVAEAKCAGLECPICTDFHSVPGRGATATIAGRRFAVGSPRFLDSLAGSLSEQLAAEVASLHAAGKTCVCLAELKPGNSRVLGIIGIADVLRDDAIKTIRHLKAIGVSRIVMLSGDHEGVANAIAAQAGIMEVHAGLLPQDKVNVLKSLGAHGPVAMVGDGVNDAPALAAASIGVAMGAAGSDVAMETADVVLMGDRLDNIPSAILVSRKACGIVRQNLIFSVAVIALLIASALGLQLPLPLGVIGHEGSTVLVCLNGLRMLAFKG